MVMIGYLYILKVMAALGCKLIAGIFFAFSTFVMKALAQQPSNQGIAAMQSIDVKVINPWFMTLFLGTGVVCLISIVSSDFRWQQPGAAYLLVSTLFYLIGCFGITIGFNVPLNNALAVANPDSPEGVNLWTSYLISWTFWNHIQTLDAFIAAALFTLAIRTPLSGWTDKSYLQAAE